MLHGPRHARRVERDPRVRAAGRVRNRAGPHVSTKGEMGHVVLTVLGMVAQMERRFIKERQREGIQRAKSDGRYLGGKPRIDAAKVRELAADGMRPSAIAAAIGCSRMQVYRILAREEADGRREA